MNWKKVKIISACTLISIFASISENDKIFLTNSQELVAILLTIMGLCFTSFSFISSTILKILNESKNKEELSKIAQTLLKSIEEDIFLIFYLTIILIMINLLRFTNIPLINDQTNLNFNLFIIFSLKSSIFNFITSMILCLGIYSFYDIMKATFSLIKCYYFE